MHVSFMSIIRRPFNPSLSPERLAAISTAVAAAALMHLAMVPSRVKAFVVDVFECTSSRSTVLSPLVLAADLIFLFWREVVLDVEGLANLLWRLALDHVRDGLAADVEERLDVHVVGGEDDLKEHLLVDLHELLVPVLDVGSLLARVGIIVLGWGGVVLVVGAPLEDLAKDRLGDLQVKVSITCETSRGLEWGATHVHDGDGLFTWSTKILDHVLDEH